MKRIGKALGRLFEVFAVAACMTLPVLLAYLIKNVPGRYAVMVFPGVVALMLVVTFTAFAFCILTIHPGSKP